MRTTFLPPHLTAQTMASQPVSRPQTQPQQSPAGQDGFEALALKSATPSRVITARPVETKPAEPVSQRTPVGTSSFASNMSPQPPADIDRFLRPGSRLDIRV
jgi:hypothetical protein